ncbi:MAG: HPr kinase/phosphatase C-terminal domain-containing protein [Rhodospirillales bacterium]|jgi:serine kinase of HPr protein (carbohydrate metabolism regulator)|nr:HPr kinase/phosphatase C-terminal domain-containing protein [Rhodospirillales bacterium]
MEDDLTRQVHGTAVSIGGDGVLILGEPGSGKSDLALRLIYQGAGQLISDDRVDLCRDGDTVVMSSPEQISGLLEVRGVGVVSVPADYPVTLRLIVNLSLAEEIDRQPERRMEEYLGVSVPLIKFNPFELSAPEKLRIALQIATGRTTLIE